MLLNQRFLTVVLIICFFSESGFGQNNKKRGNKSTRDDWSAEEYSGTRGEKELHAALASKGFAWLSGSPADNEKLSIGKNAQFFGFVALRYQSDRAANRGALGRAVYAIADQEQREILSKAVIDEADSLQRWWDIREKILRSLENHLYTGQEINKTTIGKLGEEFAILNASVALYEAKAFAALEDSLSEDQSSKLLAWRKNPEQAGKFAKNTRVLASGLDRDQRKQLEDLYAKAFSWITGKSKDNEIIPIGQPAQFFGFVSIRHKSGHAANRGKIAKSFNDILTQEQEMVINKAVLTQIPVVRTFLDKRHLFLSQLSYLRFHPDKFDNNVTMDLAAAMGRLEIDAAIIEANAYRTIRDTMTPGQIAAMMQMRSNYILDQSQVESLTQEQRGATIALLCVGCHGEPGQYHKNLPAPSLDGIFSRPVASSDGYEYSDALTNLTNNESQTWTYNLLDQFLASPKKFAPGTKMEFQGLLKQEDRKALIDYLIHTRK